MKKIVVAGCGLVGLETALLLKKKIKDEAKIIAINDIDFFEYRPWRNMVFRDEVAKNARIDLRSVLSGKGIGFIKGVVTGINLEKKELKLKSATETFDFLVLSLGSIIDYKEVNGSNKHALPCHNVTDCFNIRKHITEILSKARNLKGKDLDSALTIVVCGAGHTGVEIVSEVNDFLDDCCEKLDVRRIDVKLIVVEEDPQIMNSFPSKARVHAYNHLTRNGIGIKNNSKVVEIKKDVVILSDGSKIDAKTIIWCGGCKPNPTFKGSALKTDTNGGILVNTYLQTSEATVYAAGELAIGRGMTSDSFDIHSVDNSIKQAQIVSHNIAGNIIGGEKKEFIHGKGKVMVSLGKKDSMIVVGGSILTGIIANKMKIMKENSHFKKFIK